MATIKKAQFGKLVKKATQASGKVTIPPGLKKSLKKSQSGPTKITPYSSEAERIAAGGPTNLQKSKTVNKFDPNYQKPYKPKKQPKVDKYGFDTRPDKNGGMHKAQFGKMVKKLSPEAAEAMKRKPSKSNIAKGVAKKDIVNKERVNPFTKGTNRLNKVLKRDYPDLKRGGKVGKMRNGGSLSGLDASKKRMGPVDPKGAFTKVQEKTLSGSKGTASLTKDKQLGATKMKMGGKMKKC